MLLAPVSAAETASPEAGGVPAGLVYSSDTDPGITRVRRGRGFAYRDSRGRWIRDEAGIARIRKLAIPPAYTSVWICALPNGHLQSPGRDAAPCRRCAKCSSTSRTREHSRELVLATIVRLLDTTLIRVGNDQYARENGSYGLTTLRNRHVRIGRDHLKLSFRGKSGVPHEVQVKDPRVLRVVRRCLHLPGRSCSSTAATMAICARSARATSTIFSTRCAGSTPRPRPRRD